MLAAKMEREARINLLVRVARTAAGRGMPVDPTRPVSILSLAAVSYAAKPAEDATVPTGFDPAAVALFEAIVEGAYLVATADGVFDEDERRAFEHVVVAACGGSVEPKQISDLVGDLADQLQEDGLDRRLAMVAKTVNRPEQAGEVLRIAALLAHSSDDVSGVERDVLGKLASAMKLGEGAVDEALADVRKAIADAGSRQ
jgi:tellurite resistance protein